MAIIVRLDQVISNRKVKVLELSEKIGITYANLSNLKNGKVTSIRFSTLENLCKELNCQPGDILEYLDDEIIKYIDCFFKTEKEKEGALNRLYAYAIIKGEKAPSIELAKECFCLYKKTNVQDIVNVVCSYFKITPNELISNSKIKKIVKARQLALFLCRTETIETFKNICEYFNIKSINLMFACDKINEELNDNQQLQFDYKNICEELKK